VYLYTGCFTIQLITQTKVPRTLSQSGRVEKDGNCMIYKQVTKLRLFILQMKCCWYLLYTGCTSHIAQRLQNEKFVRCRQNRQQRQVFWMEISYIGIVALAVRRLSYNGAHTHTQLCSCHAENNGRQLAHKLHLAVSYLEVQNTLSPVCDISHSHL
jgi:hypothetical protein